MVTWCSSSARRCTWVIAQAAPEGGASRRRSQRLRQQGRPNRQTVEERLKQAAEQERLQQQQAAQDELAALAAQRTALDLQEQAARSLLGQQVPGQPAAEAAAAAVAEPLDSARAAGAAAAASGGVVEADYVWEQQRQPGVYQQDALHSEINRQSEVLLEIMQAGERVEEVIAENRADIDETMLELLRRRIQAAQLLEKSPDALKGLELLCRRLKTEVDRQRASPALRLLDEVIGILDPEEGHMAPTLAAEERRREAAAHLRAAFSGGLVGGGADLLTLAAQLSGGGGSQLADQLVADPVDPMAFLAEATELLNRVQEQEGQLEEQLQACTSLEAAAEAELVLQQRRAAAALVQQAVELAQAVVQQYNLL